MPAALTSAVALGYLRELSADITAAVLLDAAGERLAGPPELHAAARRLLAHAPPGPAELHGSTPAGAVFAARDEQHQLVVATGRLALPRLTRHDLRATLGALSGRAVRERAQIEVPQPLVTVLLAAAQVGIRTFSAPERHFPA
jgi:hypothetical protein